MKHISTFRPCVVALAYSLVALACNPPQTDPATETSVESEPIALQVRYQENNGADQWKTVEETVHWQPAETAIIICDMWDRHWCDGATQRVAGMAPRMNETIRAARARGVTIIHAPSSVMDFYADQPGRIRMQQAPPATPPEPFKDWYDPKPGTEPDLPIDDSDGGCDTCGNGPCTNVNQSVWTRQIETLDIADEDGISDDGPEIHNYLRHKGIKNVIIMGVHTNMCVLGRPFGIRAQRTMGMNVLLARDLTDAMYNPGMAPYVSHDEGTHRVIDHIEKYWGPTVLSDDLIKPGGH